MMQMLASFFGFAASDPRPPLGIQLIGPRIVMRLSEPTDWRSWRTLRDQSKDFLMPWEPEWPSNALTQSFFENMVRRQARDWRQGKAYSFFIFQRKDVNGAVVPGALVGGLGINDVVRGVAQKATLGYWIGQPYANQGYMTEAADLACNFAFQTLKLNRMEASCLPHNEPSRRLLKHIGFVEEGFAKSYLRINGVWQDHILWGRTTI